MDSALQQKLKICAELSKFAYNSANPGASISEDDVEAHRALRAKLILDLHQNIGNTQPDDFERFASKSWHKTFDTQERWFRSQAYFYNYLDQQENVHKIVVAFRGTWNDPSAERDYYTTRGASSFV